MNGRFLARRLLSQKNISSQKERDFKNSDYNNIKEVYSIWVCMNTVQNCMNHIHLVNENILGSYNRK